MNKGVCTPIPLATRGKTWLHKVLRQAFRMLFRYVSKPYPRKKIKKKRLDTLYPTKKVKKINKKRFDTFWISIRKYPRSIHI